MKITLKIARNELRNLFYSPVAWFLAIAFFVFCGYFFVASTEETAKWQDIYFKNSPFFKGFPGSQTRGVFLGANSLFISALKNLYLFVPLLTMGLISREFNNGTIRLLYSSPVKTRDIVLGKYLAILTFNMVLVAIVSIFVVIGLFGISHVDYGVLLCGLFAFFLLVSAYTAIGMFMSSLTNYQVLSAIGCFILLFVLGSVGQLWQKYDFIRDLTAFISINGRTQNLLMGLINSSDIAYFLLIDAMLILFTYLRLQNARAVLPWYVKTAKYLGAFLIVLVIGFFTSRLTNIWYYDTTAQQVNTLHPKTQAVVKELGDEPLQVTMYVNLLGAGLNNGFPETRNAYLAQMWSRYIRFKPNIEFKYVYYYDVLDGDSTYFKYLPGKTLEQIAALTAEGNKVDLSSFLPPDSIRKVIDLAPENMRLVMELKYKGRTTFLRTFDDPLFWPTESATAAAFKRLLQKEMPQVLFSAGHYERNPSKLGEREYAGHSASKWVRGSLTNLGFDIDTINLERQDVPTDISSLVIADPKTDFSEQARQRLSKYIDQGGNLFILAENGKQNTINPLLKQLGITAQDGLLVQPSPHEMPDHIGLYVSRPAMDMADNETAYLAKEGGDSINIMMPGAVPLKWSDSSGFAIKSILLTRPQSTWHSAHGIVVDSAAPVFNAAAGDIQADSFVTALQLVRHIKGKEQRIVVTGDADFMSNGRLQNDYMYSTIYSWLDFNRFPIFVYLHSPKDNLILLTYAQVMTIKWTFVWIIPGLLLIGATILLIRRKRQ